MDKIYIVTRRDLTLAQQAVQSAHVVAVYASEYGGDFRRRTFVVVTVSDERELKELSAKAKVLDRRCEEFYEPDLNDSLTAICLNEDSRRLCRKLPLAFR